MISCRADLFKTIKEYRLYYVFEDNREMIKYYNPFTDTISCPQNAAVANFHEMWGDGAVLIKRGDKYLLLNLKESGKYTSIPVYEGGNYLGESNSFSERNGNMKVNERLRDQEHFIDPLEYTINLVGVHIVIKKEPVQ